MLLLPQQDRIVRAQCMISSSLQQDFRLPRATEMGALLRPLDQRLREHPFCANLNGDALRAKLTDYSDNRSDAEHRNFMADIYPDLYSFFIEKSPAHLGSLQLYQGDALYLMSDPIGNILRRPFVAAYLAAAARLEVPCSSDAEPVRDLLLDCVVKMGFSKFFGRGSRQLTAQIESRHTGQSGYFDHEKVIERFEREAQATPDVVGPYVYDLDVWAMSHTSRLIALEGGVFAQIQVAREGARKNGASLPPSPFYSDAGHVFNAWEIVRVFRYHVDETLEPLIAAKRLPCDVSVMVVEDNRFFAWAIDEYRNCPQMRPFVSSGEWIEARAAMAPKDESLGVRIELERGWFKNAEDALDCLLDGLIHGRAPDVIFIDIELGSGMNGLEFARLAHEKCLAAGKDLKIMFATSSNLSFYQEAVADLQSQGIIKSSRTKAAFYLPHVIDELAEMLREKS